MIRLHYGRMPSIAKTVDDVVALKDPYSRVIMDRSKEINEDFIGSITAQAVMNWEGRKPSPALDFNGNFICTDLDLFSFLVPLAARGAIIEIQNYDNRRRKIIKQNERKIGVNQFGPIVSLVSNKDVFSFSVRIKDQTIAVWNSKTGMEELGGFRNYMIVDIDGNWYDGWKKIIWKPNLKENKFLDNNGLWTENSVHFKYYVHPARWQSIFSASHILKKMLIARLNDEAKFYRSEVKRLKELGINFPPGNIEAESFLVSHSGKTKPVKVKTMEMLLDLPVFSGEYVGVDNNLAGLQYAHRRQKILTYTWKTLIQFCIRANEVAYFLYAIPDYDKPGKIASWMGDAQWEEGWKEGPRKRKVYNRMNLNDAFALRYRIWEKTERVSVK